MESNILSFLRKHKGFTLIELLIVIAIIAILTVAFLPNALKAPARARDAGKVKTVQDIAAALEGYYNSHSNTYPAPDTSGCLVFATVDTLGLAFQPTVVNMTNTATDCTYHYWANTGATPANTTYAVGFSPENKATANSAAVIATFQTPNNVASPFSPTNGTTMYVVRGPL